jgi:23S rRNA (cytidine1920-2'-O)/16S rRNA (cytidine1409-2'-O)-methyltransferase
MESAPVPVQGLVMSDHDETETRRLDVELVRRGLAPSRAHASEMIAAGKVLVAGLAATKPGLQVSAATRIEAEAVHPWVSRGGMKLAHALDAFGVDPAGRHCLDIGASTGGFTDVLLARGAKSVIAVDVGVGQLHPKLRGDARVTSLESTDARDLTAEMLVEPPTFLVCDASFIGLAKLLQRPLELAASDARLVSLFKPQFEVGREHVGKGGIVTSDAATDLAARRLEQWLQEQGWTVDNWTPSPIFGGDGNRERLFMAVRR